MFLRFHANSLDSYNEFTPPEPISVSVFMAQHKFKLKRSFTRIVRFYANSLGLYISRYLKTFNLLTRSFIQAMILRFRANSLDFYNEFTPPEPKSVSVIILQHKLKLLMRLQSSVMNCNCFWRNETWSRLHLMSRLGVSVIDWSEDAAANEPRGVRDRNSRLNQSAFSWHLLQGFRKKVNDLCPACNSIKKLSFRYQ